MSITMMIFFAWLTFYLFYTFPPSKFSPVLPLLYAVWSVAIFENERDLLFSTFSDICAYNFKAVKAQFTYRNVHIV